MYDLESEASRLASGRMTRMQFMRRGIAAGASLSLLAEIVAACGGGGGDAGGADAVKTSTAGAPVRGQPPTAPTGKITFADSQIPRATTWDPATSIGGFDARVFSMVFEPLIDIDPDGKLMPLLAESYKRLDARTLRIHLRDGIKFHHGSTLTAHDVKATIDRLGEPGSTLALASLMAPLHVRVRDDRTADIVCDQPFGVLERALVAVRIMSAEDLANEKLLKNRANGTGPFRLVRRTPQATHLEANTDYWVPGKPYIKEVEYRTISDQGARLDALRTGAIDAITEAAPAQINQFAKSSKFWIPPQRNYAPGQYVYILTQKGAMKDVRVRRAIAHAVDREAIAKSILRGVSPIGFSALPTNDPFYREQSPRFDYDPEKAKALLAESGQPSPNFKMATSSVFEFAPEADQAVAKYLEDVGINVNLDRVDVGAYAAGVYTKYDISLNALVEFTPKDPDSLFGFYRSPLDKVVFNHHDPKMSNLATRQRFVAGEAREVAVDKASGYIWNQQPLLYLADAYGPEIVSTRVSNYTPTPSFGLIGVKDAWVATA